MRRPSQTHRIEGYSRGKCRPGTLLKTSHLETSHLPTLNDTWTEPEPETSHRRRRE
jgi:hypothetical protein